VKTIYKMHTLSFSQTHFTCALEVRMRYLVLAHAQIKYTTGMAIKLFTCPHYSKDCSENQVF
jgi:hypothetical protein